jgi:hypothetical protein
MKSDTRILSPTDQLAKHLEDKIAPNVYAVIHVKRSVNGEWWNRERIDEATAKFMVAVSKAVHGSRKWRKLDDGKRLLAYATTLEKADTNPHLNLLIHRPDGMDFQKFHDILYDAWLKTGWMAQDVKAFYCEERQPGSKVTGYVLKEGTDSLLERAMNHNKA